MTSDKEKIEEAFQIANIRLYDIIYAIQNIAIDPIKSVSKAELTEFIIDMQDQLKKAKKKFIKENFFK